MDTKASSRDIREELEWQCICDRPKTTVLCNLCNLFSLGRVSRCCPIHKNVHFLMDFRVCAFCKAPESMLQEVDVDFNTVKKVNDAKLQSKNYPK